MGNPNKRQVKFPTASQPNWDAFRPESDASIARWYAIERGLRDCPRHIPERKTYAHALVTGDYRPWEWKLAQLDKEQITISTLYESPDYGCKDTQPTKTERRDAVGTFLQRASYEGIKRAFSNTTKYLSALLVRDLTTLVPGMPMHDVPVSEIDWERENSVTSPEEVARLLEDFESGNGLPSDTKRGRSSQLKKFHSGTASTALNTVPSLSRRLQATFEADFRKRASIKDSTQQARLVSGATHIWVTNEEELFVFLKELDSLKDGVMEIMMDGEWCQTDELGTVLTNLEIKLCSKGVTYLLDRVLLGPKMWDTPSQRGKTLGGVFGDPNIPIGVFDIRGDQFTIFNTDGITIKCGVDLQLLFLVAICAPKEEYLPSLLKATRYLPINKEEFEEWRQTKNAGKDYWSRHGTEVFLRRPLEPILATYAAGDTEYMGHMYAYCMLQPRMQSRALQAFVMEETRERIEDAIFGWYDPGSKKNSWTSQKYGQLKDADFGTVKFSKLVMSLVLAGYMGLGLWSLAWIYK